MKFGVRFLAFLFIINFSLTLNSGDGSGCGPSRQKKEKGCSNVLIAESSKGCPAVVRVIKNSSTKPIYIMEPTVTGADVIPGIINPGEDKSVLFGDSSNHIVVKYVDSRLGEEFFLKTVRGNLELVDRVDGVDRVKLAAGLLVEDILESKE